jgi:hypothetical protein
MPAQRNHDQPGARRQSLPSSSDISSPPFSRAASPSAQLVNSITVTPAPVPESESAAPTPPPPARKKPVSAVD